MRKRIRWIAPCAWNILRIWNNGKAVMKCKTTFCVVEWLPQASFAGKKRLRVFYAQPAVACRKACSVLRRQLPLRGKDAVFAICKEIISLTFWFGVSARRKMRRYALIRVCKTRRMRHIATSIVVLPDGSVLLRTRPRKSARLRPCYKLSQFYFQNKP